jgi:hypothetical protein
MMTSSARKPPTQNKKKKKIKKNIKKYKRYPSIQLPSLSKILDMIDDNRVKGEKTSKKKSQRKSMIKRQSK